MEWLAILGWLLAVVLLSALAAPISAAIFATLPGRGGAFAPHVGLVAVGLVSFWVGQLRYGWVALGASLVVLGLLSGAVYHRGHIPSLSALIEGYLVFLGGFAFALVVRITDNTIGPAGGEQFLHFGLLNAVERAASLPPEDMWWAGDSVNYYYGGHVLVDQLARLSFVEPRLAYNLGLATVFGLTAAAAYGLVGGILDGYGYRPRVGGVVGAGLVLLAGTFTTPVRLVFGQLPTELATRYGAFAFEGRQFGDPLEEVIASYGDIGAWGWWFERRVVDGMLVETPLYSLVKADLHGHVTTIPFTIVLIAVAFTYYQTPAGARWRRLALLGLVFPALAGLVGWMNTWSLPGAVGIAWLALAFAPAHPLSVLDARFETDVTIEEGMAGLRTEVTRLVSATIGAGLVGLLGAATIAPFLLFQLPTNDGIGLVSERSPLGGHLLLFGGFFAVFALFIAVALWHRYGDTHRIRRGAAIAIATTIAAVGLGAAGFASLAIAAPMAVLAWWLVRRRPSIGFIGVLIVGTLGLILAMELVHAEVWPPERERLNTTYKVSMQAMVFGLLATAAIATALVSDRLPSRGWRPSLGSTVVVLAVICLVVLFAVFPVMTLYTELDYYTDDRSSHSIDALEGQEWWNPDVMAGVSFIDALEGTPTLLEAPGETTYTFSNPASSFTGVPSVVGWAHQRGYRGVEAYEARQDDADAIYAGDRDTAVALLEHYSVEYIWVGQNEHDRYGDELREFGSLAGVSVVFEQGAVTIYAVDQTALAS